MKIEKAQLNDLTLIKEIYNDAIKYMRDNGNINQWNNDYPSISLLTDDINKNALYKILDDNEIIGVFYFKLTEDETYNKIFNGAWLNDEPYGVIHRIAGTKKSGILKNAISFAFNYIDNLRIDTHEDNKTMINALNKYGFTQCGIILTYDKTTRLAFHKKL